MRWGPHRADRGAAMYSARRYRGGVALLVGAGADGETRLGAGRLIA
jgi:hypothetical protein